MAVADFDTDTLQGTVKSLSAEVLRLQKKLDELHVSDVNALKRANKSLCQHVETLHAESEVIQSDIDAIETQLLAADDIGEEFPWMAFTAGGWALAKKYMAHTPMAQHVLVAGLLVVTGRVFHRTCCRVSSMLTSNKQHKQQLQQDWKEVKTRINIMQSLVANQPALK